MAEDPSTSDPESDFVTLRPGQVADADGGEFGVGQGLFLNHSAGGGVRTNVAHGRRDISGGRPYGKMGGERDDHMTRWMDCSSVIG